MPPVEAPAGWSWARCEAFRAFHRANYAGLAGPNRTVMYAIHCNSEVVGMIRMSWVDEPHTLETGMWLGRSARGRGIGVAALRALLTEAGAVGAERVVADTTVGNEAALSVLRRCGAVLRRCGDRVRAELSLDG